MKQLLYNTSKTLADKDAFYIQEMEKPAPAGRDLLIRIDAVSVNPVDTKIRARNAGTDRPLCLGWDASGVVEETGEQVTLFKPGDKVIYAGDITRPGSNATHQLVDERIVGRHPKSLSSEQAAALPLTGITAYEALFARMKIDPLKDNDKTLLIIGAAGGVGSMAIQLAKKPGKLQVIATASRNESVEWCRSLGADHILNHHQDLRDQLVEKNLHEPDYILCLNDTDYYYNTMADLIAPQGLICCVVDAKQPHDLSKLKNKSAGLVWEFMFTRAMYHTSDMIRQHELLNEIADCIDRGEVRTTLNTVLGEMNPESIREAHQLLEAGRSIGKTVLTGLK